jgi:hypothetical protein
MSNGTTSSVGTIAPMIYDTAMGAQSTRMAANMAMHVSLMTYGITVLGLDEMAASSVAEEVMEHAKEATTTSDAIELVQRYRSAAKGVLPL